MQLFLLFFALCAFGEGANHKIVGGPVVCSYVHSDCSIQEGCLLVDLRAPAAYEAFHISGSINLSLFALAAKGYLKSKHVVLIGENDWDMPSQAQVDRLKKVGFRHVSWLDGGLKAWAAAGLPLTGDPFAAADWSMVPPSAVFHAGGSGKPFQLVQLQEHKVPAGFPDMLSLPVDNGDVLGDKVLAFAQQIDGEMLLVFVDRDGSWRSLFERTVHPEGLSHVYFLEGGQAAMKAFLEGGSGSVTSVKTPDAKLSSRGGVSSKKSCDCNK